MATAFSDVTEVQISGKADTPHTVLKGLHYAQKIES